MTETTTLRGALVMSYPSALGSADEPLTIEWPEGHSLRRCSDGIPRWQPWEKRSNGLGGSMSVEFIGILTEVWSRCSLGWGCALAHGSRNDLSPRRT